MVVVHPYIECLGCTYITDCKHPTVSCEGAPQEPDECQKKGSIKIEQKPDEI